MPEQSGRTVPYRIPPVVFSLSADPATTQRMQETFATIVHAAPILADFEAKMASTLVGPILADFEAKMTPTLAGLFADFDAKMAPTLAGLFASVPETPPSILRPPVVTSNAALANRVVDALDRNTAFVVSTVASSVGPVAVSANNIDANVATIAKPRLRRLTLLFQVVGMFTVLVGAADAIVHLLGSLIH